MSIVLKTEYGNKLLELSNEALINQVNLMLSNKAIDKDFLSDLKAIHRFILDHHFGVNQLNKSMTPHGLYPLKYVPVVNMVIDFSEPLHKLVDLNDKEELLAAKYLQMKMNAKKRGIEFKLTIANMRNLLRRTTCYYSKIRFDDVHTQSIDRKDNTRGYTIDNVVVCSSLVNNLKEKLMENHRVIETMSQQQIEKMLDGFNKVTKEKIKKEKADAKIKS